MQKSKNAGVFSTVVLGLWLLSVAGGASAAGEEDYRRGFDAFKSDDLITAMQYLESASAQGHAQAQYLLGYILDTAEENDSARDLYLKAAEAGNGDAAYALGAMYASGDGVERDGAKALTWFQRAVDVGHGPASVKLGMAYINGEFGLSKDPERGRAILQRSADAGYDAAQRLLEQPKEQ